MLVDRARIAQMEKALEEARAQLWKEEAKCYEIVMRDISEGEKERILKGLTDKHERILFGLDVAEEPRGLSAGRSGKSGGDLTCTVCGKSGLTKRGLGLHMSRMHKEEKREEEPVAALSGR